VASVTLCERDLSAGNVGLSPPNWYGYAIPPPLRRSFSFFNSISGPRCTTKCSDQPTLMHYRNERLPIPLSGVRIGLFMIM